MSFNFGEIITENTVDTQKTKPFSIEKIKNNKKKNVEKTKGPKNGDNASLEKLVEWLEEEIDAKLQQINSMVEKVRCRYRNIIIYLESIDVSDQTNHQSIV